MPYTESERKERQAAARKKYREANREKVLESKRAWRERNLREVRKKDRDRAYAHRVEKRIASRAYYWANKKAVLEAQSRRRRGFTEAVDPVQRKEVTEADKSFVVQQAAERDAKWAAVRAERSAKAEAEAEERRAKAEAERAAPGYAERMRFVGDGFK